MDSSILTHTFNYKKWADQRTLKAIAQIDRSRFADAYAFVLQQINHMVIVEELFKSRLTGESAPHKSTNTEKVPDYEELKDRLIASGDWYIHFITGHLDSEKTVSFIFADGKRGSMTVAEILFHVVNHGSYHRGNIAHALDLAAVPHPVDGYGLYIHEKEPDRRLR